MKNIHFPFFSTPHITGEKYLLCEFNDEYIQMRDINEFETKELALDYIENNVAKVNQKKYRIYKLES